MKQYIVDAFTDKIFSGNQAAVCILDKWISDDLMQNIAMENNLSETAFAVKQGDYYQLRWFTPAGEIDFCGHATLGTAYVINRFYDVGTQNIKFKTMVGDLLVSVYDDVFEMNFPAYSLNEIPVTDDMTKAIGIKPESAFIDRDLMLVIDSELDIKKLNINQEALKKLDGLCVAVTAKSKKYDCVSRVFASELNVPEDPVTGSTHCMIIPYWAKTLNKDRIVAYQASSRGGILYSKIENDRVKMAGKAVLYSISEILVDYNLGKMSPTSKMTGSTY